MATSRIKSLAGDTMIYGTFTIMGRFLTFLLTPIYTNYLPISQVGDITYIFSILAFLNIINGFGMESSFFRFYSKDDLHHTRKVYTNTYLTITMISATISISAIIFAEPIAAGMLDIKGGATLIRLAALIPLLDAQLIIPYAYLRMTRKAKKFAGTRFFLIIVAVMLNIFFVVILRWEAKGVLIAQICANAVGAILFFPETFKFIIPNIDFKLLKNIWRFGIPTMPAMLSSMIMQVADRPILKALTDSTQVGLYTVNCRLGLPMMLFVSVFEYAWKPFYLSRYEDKDAKELFARVLTYFTLVAAVIFLVTGFFIQYIIQMPFVGGKLINPKYWSGLGVIPFVLAGYFFNGVFNNLAAGFQINKKTEYLPLAVGVGALLSVGLNFTLIPVIGYYGAAWSVMISYFASAFFLYLYSRKVYPIAYQWRKLGIIAGLSLGLYFISTTLTEFMPLISKLAFRAIALVIFFTLLYTLKVISRGELRAARNMFRREQTQI